VVDASEAWTDADSNLLSKVQPLGALLVAFNKSDLPRRISSQSEIPRGVYPERTAGILRFAQNDTRRARNDKPGDSNATPVVWTSALTGEGIHELKEKILEIAAPARDLGTEGEFITNLRHQQLLKDSLQALAKARQAAELLVPHEMLLLDLYEALRPLDDITGATYADDVLGIIFSTFCVGK